MKRIITATVAMFVFSLAAFGNIADPQIAKRKSAKAIDTTLSINLDREAKEARLIIPRSQLKQLRAELESVDDGTDDTAAASTGGVTRLQTIISGGFLSLAFVFGGMWLARSGRLSTKRGKAAAAAAVVFASGAFATLVFANAGPPPEARSITGKMFTQAVHMYGFASGKIKLEVSDEARYVELIVPNRRERSKSEK